MKQQVAVSGFLVNNHGEILVVKRSDTDDFLPGFWEVPGGGIEVGENPQQGLVRECKEETGLAVVVGKPLFVADYEMEEEWIPHQVRDDDMQVRDDNMQVRDDKKIHRVEIFFACSLANSKQPVVLSNEHQAYKWITKEQIDQFAFTDYMQKAFEESLS